MTARPPRARRASQRPTAALLVTVLLAVLAIAVGPAGRVDTQASTTAGQVAGTRVRVHNPAQQAVVAASGDVLAGQGRAATTPAAKEVVGSRVAPRTAGSLNLPLRDAGLRSQVDDVVRHFDEFGTPPPGIRQGIRAGGERGVFQNVNGTLPRQADPRYYTEMDVWAGTGPRGTERLVTGRGGEVYYTPNHYESFVRLR